MKSKGVTLLFVSARETPAKRYVAKWLKEHQQAGGDASALAKNNGLVPSNLSQVRDGILGIGAKNGDKWARLVGLSDHSELIRVAKAWAALPPKEREKPIMNAGRRRLELDERYPNRAIAVKIARQLELAEFAIAQVEALQATEDPPARWWLEQIQAHDKILGDPFRPKGPSGRKETEDL